MSVSETICKIVKMMDMSNFCIGAIHFVKVTHINDPKSFYICLSSVYEDVKLLEVQGNQICSSAIQLGKQVIYKSRILKKYVRGVIQVIDRGSYYVFAMDYGCMDKYVPLNDIYSLATDIQCPALAFHCQLDLCEPKGDKFDDNAIEAMKFFVGKHTGKITIMSKSMRKFSVKLNTVECSDDVSTMLALLHCTTLTSCTNTVNRFTAGPLSPQTLKYKYRDFKIGDQVRVIVQSGDTIDSFYVIEASEFKKYITSKPDFTKYCKEQKIVDIVSAVEQKRSCGVRLATGEYERAIILNVTDQYTKAIVKLIDLGSVIETSFFSIKAVTSEVYTLRHASAIYCSSTEEQTWDTGLPKFLYPGYQFMIEIVEVGNNLDIPHKVNISPLTINC